MKSSTRLYTDHSKIPFWFISPHKHMVVIVQQCARCFPAVGSWYCMWSCVGLTVGCHKCPIIYSRHDGSSGCKGRAAEIPNVLSFQSLPAINPGTTRPLFTKKKKKKYLCWLTYLWVHVCSGGHGVCYICIPWNCTITNWAPVRQ